MIAIQIMDFSIVCSMKLSILKEIGFNIDKCAKLFFFEALQCTNYFFPFVIVLCYFRCNLS